MPLRLFLVRHGETDQPAIALWNSAAHETFAPAPHRGDGDARSLKQQAIERWENEGGEIPPPTRRARST